MRNLHILYTDKFVKPYIDFVNKNFNPDEHFFIVICSDLNANFITKYNNVRVVYNKIINFSTLIKMMYKSKSIIIHSLFIPKILLLLFFQPWLLKKCHWVVWGGDLYSYQKKRVTIKAKFKEQIRAFVIKRLGNILTLVKGDYCLAKKWYGVTGRYYHCAYVNPISKDYLDSLPKNYRKNKDNLIIQIGNSADSSNNHIEILNVLKRFEKENIIIFAPLSYGGERSYVLHVIEEGKRLFGDKFIPLTEYLPPQKYSLYLNNIDVAIFNNNRQQALGNIYALLYLNKKVFIRSDTSMWSHFKENFDIELNDVLKIESLDFKEFSDLSNVQNKIKISKVFEEDYLVKIWTRIFNGDNH